MRGRHANGGRQLAHQWRRVLAHRGRAADAARSYSHRTAPGSWAEPASDGLKISSSMKESPMNGGYSRDDSSHLGRRRTKYPETKYK